MTTSFEIKCDICDKLFSVTDKEFELICNSFGATCSDECLEKLKQIMDKRKYHDVGGIEQVPIYNKDSKANVHS